MKTAIIAIALVFAGCATPEQRAAHSLEKQGPYCTALGYEKGTTEWRDCVVKRQESEDALVRAAIYGR